MAITLIETQTPDSGRKMDSAAPSILCVNERTKKKIVNKSFAARSTAEHLFDQRFLTRRRLTGAQWQSHAHTHARVRQLTVYAAAAMRCPIKYPIIFQFSAITPIRQDLAALRFR